MQVYTLTLVPSAPEDPANYRYAVDTTGKRRRYLRGIFDTLEEAEQFKSRIKERWQPTIYPMYCGPYHRKDA